MAAADLEAQAWETQVQKAVAARETLAMGAADAEGNARRELAGEAAQAADEEERESLQIPAGDEEEDSGLPAGAGSDRAVGACALPAQRPRLHGHALAYQVHVHTYIHTYQIHVMCVRLCV